MKLELRSLRVINCGPLRDVCIHFNTEGEHPVTVLAGANGSGKTTALELVYALSEMLLLGYKPSFDAGLPSILARADYAQADMLRNNQAFSLFCGQRPSDAHLPELYFGKTNFNHVTPDRISGTVTDLCREILDQKNAAVNVAAFGEVTLSQKKDFVPSILYFPHNRQLTSLQGEQVQREDVTYNWIYRYNSVPAFKGSLDSYLVWLDYAEPETFALITNFLNSLNFDGKTFSVHRKELKAIVTTRAGNKHYLEELSSGEQNILITMVELRRRLLPGSIVLIDEIENSLHPAFQHRIAEGLMRLQEMVPFQLIATTHSPTFVDIFGTGSTRILTEF